MSIGKGRSDQIAHLMNQKYQVQKLKNFKDFLKNIKSKSALFIHHKDAPKEFVRSIKNIPNSKKLEDVGTNVYDLIKYEKVLFTKVNLLKQLKKD